MTPAVAVILGLSVVTIVLLLGAFFATTGQGRKGGEPEPSGEPPPPPPLLSAPAEAAQPPQPNTGRVGIDYPDPRMIRVGDTITCQGVRSGVLGAMHLSWQGTEWTEYLLDDGTRRYQWLSVEERPGSGAGDPPTWRCCCGRRCPLRA